MGVTVLAGVIHSKYAEEIGLLLHKERKEEYTRTARDSSGLFLLLSCSVIVHRRETITLQFRQDGK